MSKYGVISGAYFPVFGTRDPNSYNKSFQNIDIMKFGKALVVLTGAQLEGGGGRSPLPKGQKLGKGALNCGKNTLTVIIYG